MMDTSSCRRLRRKVIKSAVFSRLSILLLAVVSDLVLPNHQSEDAFRWSSTSSISFWSDRIVCWLTDCLTRWDGQHFLHIADQGYVYEHSLAFFPLFPALMRGTGEFLYWLQVDYGLLGNFSSALKLAAVLINLGAFVVAAVLLFDLSIKVLRDEYLAYKATLYFCLNPASIFFSAAYSESLHAAFSFLIMLKTEKGVDNFQIGLFLAASSALRSNGLLNLGFVLYKSLHVAAKEVAIHRRLVYLGRAEISTTVANILGDSLIPALFGCLFALTPFILFQAYGYTQFCRLTRPSLEIPALSSSNGYKLATSEPSDWCFNFVPIPYAYVQAHYWEVGFLKFWRPRNVLWWLLAAPVLTLVAWQSWKFCRRFHPCYVSRLGLTHFGMDPAQKTPPFDPYKTRGLPKECFVYVAHAIFLWFFCLTFVHIQVSTRMFASSSPVIFWWAAILTTSDNNHSARSVGSGKTESLRNLISPYRCILVDEAAEQDLTGRLINSFFMVYAVIGTLMFANGLPFV